MSTRSRAVVALDTRDALTQTTSAVVEPGRVGELRVRVDLDDIARAATLVVEHGGRFVTTFVGGRAEPSLLAVLAHRAELIVLRAPLPDEPAGYPSLGAALPAARWAEREAAERHGLRPDDPPGSAGLLTHPDADVIQRRVHGDDVFAIPYGPVRSGVFEAIQFVVETGGEDIPALDTRPFFKHRGMERRFAGLDPGRGAHVAERVAGIASVAHVVAYAEAVERALEVEVPERALHWRALYAELERIANHLDVMAKEAETAALTVGQARFLIHKENVLRLQAALTGSRFARGVVVPGGVREEGRLPLPGVRDALDLFEHDLAQDRELLLGTTSFTDRLIGTGRLDRQTVAAFGGVGPVARGSGLSTDARFERPYGAYARVGFDVVTRQDGDAMARIEVRLGEIGESLHLLRQVIDRLRRRDGGSRVPLPPGTGAAIGWSEAPQGELAYVVAVAAGHLEEVHIASPSLRNWALFAESFRGDVLTDFGFIEHSFGLTPAGADR